MQEYAWHEEEQVPHAYTKEPSKTVQDLAFVQLASSRNDETQNRSNTRAPPRMQVQLGWIDGVATTRTTDSGVGYAVFAFFALNQGHAVSPPVDLIVSPSNGLCDQRWA